MGNLVPPKRISRLLTRKEAAEKLRICLTTLDKLVSSKEISTFTIGKKRLISENELIDFINRGGKNE